MANQEKKLGKSWFHPSLDSTGAESLLKQRGKAGSFLVRPSKERPGQCTLSVKDEEGNIHHIQIFQDEEACRLGDKNVQEAAASIPELLNLYLNKCIQMSNATSLTLAHVLNNSDPVNERWFHGYMTGKEAEELLRRHGKRRSFLVRESHSEPGNYCLTVRTTKQREECEVIHIRINKEGSMYEIEGVGKSQQFGSLQEVVDAFMEQSLSVVKKDMVVSTKYPLNCTLITTAYIKKRIDLLTQPPPGTHFKSGFEEDFLSLQNEATDPGLTKTIASDPENKPKNRYKNILPYDQTLVVLKDGGQNYINANYIKTEDIDKEIEPVTYIATQGPLAHTMVDFWRMIVQENSRIIVMTTKVVERGKNKCSKYWPDEMNPIVDYVTEAGTISVTFLKESTTEDGQLREFSVKVEGENPIEPRTVYQYHFIAWPDFGVPKNPGLVLHYLRNIKMKQNELSRSVQNLGPAIVHCSAGIGRSGTVIVLDILQRQIDKAGVNGAIDIMDVIRGLRRQREGMIQTEPQYKFLYVTIEHYVGTMLQRMDETFKPESTEYENLYSVMRR